MKKELVQIKIIGLLLVAAVITSGVFTSCNKIIDLEPYENVNEDSAFESPSTIELSVLGMYEAAKQGFYDAGYRGYPLGAAFVQQGDCRGEDVVNIYAFYRFTYEGSYSTTSANNVWYWSDTYRAINRTNIVIEGVQQAAQNGVLSQEIANEYLGEARFLRAILHYELLMHFARPYRHTPDASHPGVPYREIAYVSNETIEEGKRQGRNTVADCYDKILVDLSFAEENLPMKSERSGRAKIIRATSEAAIAYKTRIYLHMWNPDMVIAEGEKPELSGAYSLMTEPWGVFTNNYENSESVFSMENTPSSNPGVNAALASQYNNRLLVCISPIIWRNTFWLEDDKRRDSDEMVINASGRMFTQKYKDVVGFSDASPVIRYAEVILNIAEAYARRNQAGDFNQALNHLNMVRNRALADPVTQSYQSTDFADHLELLDAILAERRIELLMEGRRWPDIHRLQQCPHFPVNGIPTKLANGMPPVAAFNLGEGEYSGALGVVAIPYDDHRFLWPIPQNEVNSNPTLRDQQNPGW